MHTSYGRLKYLSTKQYLLTEHSDQMAHAFGSNSIITNPLLVLADNMSMICQMSILNWSKLSVQLNYCVQQS